MGKYVYDIECFKNLFTATFVALESDDTYSFCIGLGRDDSSALADFLSKAKVLVGYNNIDYDAPMLRYARDYRGENINEALLNLSNKLINDNFKKDDAIFALRYPKPKDKWRSIDLMRMLAFDKMGISLKQTAINLKWDKIQDLPYPPGASIMEKDLETVLEYNLNDVLITKKLYETLAPLHEMRDGLGKIYNVDLSSASNSKIANILLEKIYATETNINIAQIKDKRTERGNIRLGDCIASFIRFSTPQLKDLYQRIASKIVYEDENYKYSETVDFADCSFSLGVGGLHSEDAPGVFKSDDDYLIQDMDVASYYPNLIINNKFYPEHLGEEFIRILKLITERRLEAKHSGRKTEADGLKITVNSIFGKLGFPNFWLYDPKQFLSTTISGQLGLLMLIEGLHMNGIHVISANTDGIICKIPRNKLDKYYEIADKWQKISGLTLEYTPYKKYVRRDVNSYITQKEDGGIKAKGAFLEEIELNKAYRMPIIAIALRRYFIDGVSVDDTLYSSRDIMDFCVSQKSGRNFEIELATIHGVEKLQKTNRFFISKTGAAFQKRERTDGRVIGLYVGRNVTILNDFDKDKPFEEYDIDYTFYRDEVYKIIDKIDPPQLNLF